MAAIANDLAGAVCGFRRVVTVPRRGLDEGWSDAPGEPVSPTHDRRRALEHARTTFRGNGLVTSTVTPDVQGSWSRCNEVPVGRVAPVELDDPMAHWNDSPLRRAAGDVIEQLSELARREDYVAAIADPLGRIIWSSAGPSMRRRAERANFVNGANWSEGVAGTNAPGLTLQTGRPAQVFASEHWCSTVQDWVCYSAPVRDRTGRVAGVLDLSAHWEKASPLALTTVTALAKVVELELHASTRAPDVRLKVLGEPGVEVRGQRVHLSNRQLEILTILALRDAADRDELQELLYGDRPVSASTLKSEISHLRRVLDGGIESRPYRLTLDIDADVTLVLDALRHGDIEGAARAYAGSLLPASESPYIVETRHHVDVALREELFRQGTTAQLLVFADHHPYDRAILEHALAVTAADSALHSDVVARLSTDHL